MGQCDPLAFLDITVHGIKNKKVLLSKFCMEYILTTLAKVNKFGQPILIVRLQNSRTKTKMGQNDPSRHSNVKTIALSLVSGHLYYATFRNTRCLATLEPLQTSLTGIFLDNKNIRTSHRLLRNFVK